MFSHASAFKFLSLCTSFKWLIYDVTLLGLNFLTKIAQCRNWLTRCDDSGHDIILEVSLWNFSSKLIALKIFVQVESANAADNSGVGGQYPASILVIRGS